MSALSKMALYVLPVIGGLVGSAALTSTGFAQQFSTSGQTIGGPGVLTNAGSTPTAVWQSADPINICVSILASGSGAAGITETVILRPSGKKATAPLNSTTTICAGSQSDVFISASSTIDVYWRVDVHP